MLRTWQTVYIGYDMSVLSKYCAWRMHPDKYAHTEYSEIPTSFIASTVMFLLAAAFVMKDTYALRAESAKYVSSSSVKPLEVLRTFQMGRDEERVEER